jgi:hypothetical protein
MKMDNRMYYITLAVISFIILFAILALWWSNDTSKVAARCNINDIKYLNVSPEKCWMAEFNSTRCPYFGQVDCSFELQGLARILSNMVTRW